MRISKNSIKNAEEIAAKSIGLYGIKTSKRIMEYANKSGINLNHEWEINGIKVPSIWEIIEDINRDLDIPAPQFMHLMHGDFCFSNILYDFKSQSINLAK